MAAEEKKYLVNVESNLDEYAKKAKMADQAVTDFVEANARLLTSSDKTSEEYIKASAQLKVLQKNRSDANKMVENAVRVQNAEVGSYDKLYQAWKNAQVQLKLMPNMYTINEKGVRVLSTAYIEQSKKVADAKKALDDFGRGVHDNRLNVGNYTDSIKQAMGEMNMMPGALGQVTSQVGRLGTAFKALLANPVVAALAAIVGVLGLLGKAFKNSQVLMDAWEKVSSALAATFNVLLDRVSNFAEFLGSIFSKELRESRAEAKALNDELLGIDETMTRQEKRKIRRESRKGVIEEIKEEAKQARDLTDAEQALEDAEIAFIQRRAEMKRSIEELFSSTKDENLSNQERVDNLDEAIRLTKEMTAIEMEFAKERARISQERVDQGNSTREELRANEEAQAHAAEVEAQGFKEIKRLGSERLSLIRKMTAEEKKALEEREKMAEAELEVKRKAMEESKKLLTKEIEDYRKHMEELRLMKEEEAIAQAEREREIYLSNQENLLTIREYNADNIFNIERRRLALQKEEEIKIAEQTGADVNLIRAKYSAINRDIDRAEYESKLMLYQDFAGSLAQLFGEQTAIGKIAAVAQATINTYLAASKALATYPPPMSYIAMAASIATGIANVKKILEVKSGLPGDTGGGGSIPTAISASAPAQRAFAPSTGTTFFNQPQLSQEQLNTLPNQQLLTAEDITAAIAKMPAPVVTVEDINAKTAAVKKVNVRATI